MNGGFVSWTEERSHLSRLVMTFTVHTVDVLAENIVVHGKTTQDVKIDKADKMKHEKSDKAGGFDDDHWIIWYSLDIIGLVILIFRDKNRHI